jgi:CHAT domain-containing protein
LANPVVHIASHFRFLPGSDQSFLLLGDGGNLTLGQVRTEALPYEAVDLLTLSACETAVGGGHNEYGVEVEGLGVLAQQQGARAVLATLWAVADASTGQLMQQFYRLRQDGQVNKAEALRRAQLVLLNGAAAPTAATPAASADAARGASRPSTGTDAPPFESDPKRPYAHPYFWAPFILMGNWL